MKVHLIVKREASVGLPVAYWVDDAVDEWTLDEWNGDYPDELKKKLADPNTRVLIVELPEDALERPFGVQHVKGVVSGP